MDTPLSILVAEDDLGDAALLRCAFEKAKVNPPSYFAKDGQEVLDYLQGRPPFENPVEFPLPNLLLLDLTLPRVNGFEVLQWLRAQPGLKRMLVFVFTSSERPQDMDRAYALGANAYIIKPLAPAELVRIVKRIQEYWLSINSTSMEPSGPLLAAG